MTLWMPAFIYPVFKRLAWRWICLATFHGRWAKVLMIPTDEIVAARVVPVDDLKHGIDGEDAP